MKKVAIVSCYFQHNYGSMLQAYATQKALDKLAIENETINILGIDSEIRRDKWKYFIKASITSDILLSKFGMVKKMIIKKVPWNKYAVNSQERSKKFEEFKEKQFRLSEVYQSKSELHKQCKEKYSAVLVGSDQLWLPGNIAADYYTLNFVPDNMNSIAYATSFGQASLPKDSEKKAKIFLKRIKHISIREKSGQKLVEQLVGRNVPVVCDPTMLFTGEEWLEIQKEEPVVNEKYIFCYFLGNNSLHREFAKNLKKRTGYKIVALIHLDEYIRNDEKYTDATPYDIGPAEFLNLIRNAEYVCTDSFHCSLFSILYRRKFFAFRRYSSKTKQSTNSRLDTLFSTLGINERIMNGNEDIEKCINLEIDYDVVQKNMEIVRKKSYDYLKAALKNDGSTDCD